MARRPYSVNSCEEEADIMQMWYWDTIMCRNDSLVHKRTFTFHYILELINLIWHELLLMQTNLQLLQIVLLNVLRQIVDLQSRARVSTQYDEDNDDDVRINEESVTCMELVMVLRAKMVAQSFTVDWLSKAPWVSINTTATCRRRDQIQNVTATLHERSCVFTLNLLFFWERNQYVVHFYTGIMWQDSFSEYSHRSTCSI